VKSVDVPEPHVGVLVLRAWTEHGDARLRARVSITADVASSPTSAFVTADTTKVVEAVAAFLRDFSSSTRDEMAP
jgi:hypothetical protein